MTEDGEGISLIESVDGFVPPQLQNFWASEECRSVSEQEGNPAERVSDSD